MARLFSSRDRPVDFGVLPTERLPRDAGALSVPARQPVDANAAGPDSMAGTVPEYAELCASYLDGAVAPARAPVPDDLATRSKNLKATAYQHVSGGPVPRAAGIGCAKASRSRGLVFD